MIVGIYDYLPHVEQPGIKLTEFINVITIGIKVNSDAWFKLILSYCFNRFFKIGILNDKSNLSWEFLSQPIYQIKAMPFTTPTYIW